MLLTISTTHRPATDLGFLLHKHPDRLQTFDVPFGQAHVVYPDASEERCTAALVLDVDPVGLVRRGRGGSSFALAEYVNDRPYVASSFLSVAMLTVFRSAMAGTAKDRPELAAAGLPLEGALPAGSARGGGAAGVLGGGRGGARPARVGAARLRGRGRAAGARPGVPGLGHGP